MIGNDAALLERGQPFAFLSPSMHISLHVAPSHDIRDSF